MAVDFETFQRVLNRPGGFREPGEPEEYCRGFQVFDKDMTGHIGVGELKYILTNLGEKMSEEEVDELLKAVDTSSGQVNYIGTSGPCVASFGKRLANFRAIGCRARADDSRELGGKVYLLDESRGFSGGLQPTEPFRGVQGPPGTHTWHTWDYEDIYRGFCRRYVLA